MLLVSLFVTLNFPFPEIRPCLGPFEVFAIMAVPKTAVNEHHGLVFFQNDVRFSGECLVMEAKSETLGMQGLSYQDFGSGILPADT